MPERLPKIQCGDCWTNHSTRAGATSSRGAEQATAQLLWHIEFTYGYLRPKYVLNRCIISIWKSILDPISILVKNVILFSSFEKKKWLFGCDFCFAHWSVLTLIKCFKCNALHCLHLRPSPKDGEKNNRFDYYKWSEWQFSQTKMNVTLKLYYLMKW